jgi:hypothetical protein
LSVAGWASRRADTRANAGSEAGADATITDRGVADALGVLARPASNTGEAVRKAVRCGVLAAAEVRAATARAAARAAATRCD